MNKNKNIYKIKLYFIFGCFIARLLLAYFAKIIPINYLPYFGIITFIIGIIFLKNFIYNEPKIGFFGSKAWWSNYRLIHSINYFLFTISSIYKNSNSWKILFFDAILGLVFFINNYY